MDGLSADKLNRVFLALGHPLRRDILMRLSQGEATITEIARPYELSLNAISKHLKVLEKAGLIERKVCGREHYCQVRSEPLEEVTQWLVYYQAFWTDRLDAMERALKARKQVKKSDKE